MTDSHYDGGVFTPEEAWNIDTKMDDGLPGRGKIVTNRYDDCSMATAVTQLDVEYRLTSTSRDCPIVFVDVW